MIKSQEQKAVADMGVVNLTSVWGEDNQTALKQNAGKRCNLTPAVIRSIESGEEVWIRNNVTGFIDRAMTIKRHYSEEDRRIWREAKTELLRKATGKAYRMECREKGYNIQDWAYLERVERPRSETPWLVSVAFQSQPGFGIAPVVICGHGLDQADIRKIPQKEIVHTCIHGNFIQGSGENTGGHDDRVVKSFHVPDPSHPPPSGIKRELHVVIKKNYDTQCCEVITAFWPDEFDD